MKATGVVLEGIDREQRVALSVRQVPDGDEGMFDYAIDRGWMQPPNPALGSKQAKSKHKPTPNSYLEWGQLPNFFEDLKHNEPGASVVTLLAVKVLVMTFLRGGSLTPARWEEFDLKKDLWTIPADRMKTGRQH